MGAYLYGLAGIFIGLWLYHSRFMPRPKDDVQTDRTVGEVAHELKNMFRTFFVKFGLGETVCVMLFLLLYRFPEALLNTMTKTFILRPNSQGGLGLSPQEYGFANGTVGLIGLLLGGILGGILVSRDGMKKWLWPLVCAITLPDVVYIYLSYSLNSNLIVVSSCLLSSSWVMVWASRFLPSTCCSTVRESSRPPIIPSVRASPISD